MKVPRTEITFPEKLIWLTFNIIFGIIPAVYYFVWIERNMDFFRPFPAPIHAKIGWMMPTLPWFLYPNWTLTTRLIWDFALITCWGGLHSIFAQTSIHESLSTNFPLPVIRSIYMMITGVSAWLVMAFWQPTGVILWNLIPDAFISNWVNFMTWTFLFLSMLYVVSALDLFEFLGISQLYFGVPIGQNTMGTRALRTTGMHAIIRHPTHLLVLLIGLATPFMTLDRFLFVLGTVAFLLWAIPMEEAKMEKLFGAAYINYKRNVPAIVPFVY